MAKSTNKIKQVLADSYRLQVGVLFFQVSSVNVLIRVLIHRLLRLEARLTPNLASSMRTHIPRNRTERI